MSPEGLRLLRALTGILMAVLLCLGPAWAQDDLPGYLVPVRANIWEAAPGILQFAMQLAAPIPDDPNPDHEIRYFWFVDADNNARTGQRRGALGSDYNVRVVISRGPHAGAFVDDARGGPRNSGGHLYLLDGDRIYLRVPLAKLGSPSRFRWSCCAGTENSEGGNLGDNEPGRFVRPTAPFGDDQPVHLVVSPPSLQLCDGATSGTLRVTAYNAKYEPVDLAGRAVKLFPTSSCVQLQGREVSAVPGRAGLARITAMVDEVMSCNAVQVSVGRIELVPPMLCLGGIGDSKRARIEALDASNRAVAVPQDNATFRSDSPKDLTVAASGDVTAERITQETCIRATVNGQSPTNVAVACVLPAEVKLPPLVDYIGRSVAFHLFGSSPIGNSGKTFGSVVQSLDVTALMDQAWQLMHRLTGVTPSGGERIHFVTLPKPEVRCAHSGNPIVLEMNYGETGTNMFCDDAGQALIGVWMHELGHDFLVGEHAGYTTLMSQGLTSSGSWVEGLASALYLWCARNMISSPEQYRLTPTATQRLSTLYAHDTKQAADEVADWVTKGRDQTRLHTGVVIRLMVDTCDKYGDESYVRFFHALGPDTPLPFAVDTIAQQTTLIAAASSVACQCDLRSWYRETWGFAVDDQLYGQAVPVMTWNLRRYEPLADQAIVPIRGRGPGVVSQN